MSLQGDGRILWALLIWTSLAATDPPLPPPRLVPTFAGLFFFSSWYEGSTIRTIQVKKAFGLFYIVNLMHVYKFHHFLHKFSSRPPVVHQFDLKFVLALLSLFLQTSKPVAIPFLNPQVQRCCFNNVMWRFCPVKSVGASSWRISSSEHDGGQLGWVWLWCDRRFVCYHESKRCDQRCRAARAWGGTDVWFWLWSRSQQVTHLSCRHFP